jgi:hypothetical protein
MNRHEAKRNRLFKQGAAALIGLGMDADGGYICPLCVQDFSRGALEANVLTLEHVPPKSIGGKAITLTCNQCNRQAGATTDVGMAHRHTAEEFLREVGRVYVTEAKMGDHILPVRVRLTSDGGLHVKARSKHMDPRRHEAWLAYVESEVGRADRTISFRAQEYRPQLAEVGDLRAAYLAAFAQWGYTFILSPALEQVRAQLEQPNEAVLDSFICYSDDASISARALILLKTPFQCVMAQIGRRYVLLPWPRGVDPYPLARKLFAAGQKIPFQGLPIPWPTEMVMEMDAFYSRSKPTSSG